MRAVLLVDDHPLFRQGLRRLIEASGRFKIVAEASSGHEAIREADIHRPGIILMDIQLPGITGLNVARILRKQHQGTQIVMLSMHLDDEHLMDAVRAGAAGFLTKDIEASVLIESLERVAAGEQIINLTVLSRPELAWRVLSEVRQLTTDGTGPTPVVADLPDSRPSIDDQPFPLSVREIEVLDCVAQGLSNKEIATELFITEQTVKNHMTSVLRKLDVNDRVQAVLYAARNGWIEIGPRNTALMPPR